jgi:LysM repeat protein
MTEATLAKRIIAVLLLALTMMSAAACTREKPPVVEPSPTTAVALQVGTPPATVSGGVVLPTLVATAVVTPALATETPGMGIVPPALPSTSTQPIVLPTVPVSGTTGTSETQTPEAGGVTTYTIQWGDTLGKIASRFSVTSQAILAANPGLDANRINAGQVINIPAGGTVGGVTTPFTGTNPVAGVTPVPGTGPVVSGAIPGTYTVQRGDWFYAIARRFGVSVVALQAANPTMNPNHLYPGQILNIPGGGGSSEIPVPVNPGGETSGAYIVRQGDTLYSIAVRVGKSVYALQIANHLANPNFIFPGQTLVIP